MEMPLLSTRPPSGEVVFWLPAPTADTFASPWLSNAALARLASGGCCTSFWPVASGVALGAVLPYSAAHFNLQGSSVTPGFSLEDVDDPAAPFLSASLTCPLKPPEAFLVPFLLVHPWPPARFFSVRRKMEATAMTLSSQCWSSSLVEKLSLVKCSLLWKDYLVGVQLSFWTAFNNWIRHFESFRGKPVAGDSVLLPLALPVGVIYSCTKITIPGLGLPCHCQAPALASLSPDQGRTALRGGCKATWLQDTGARHAAPPVWQDRGTQLPATRQPALGLSVCVFRPETSPCRQCIYGSCYPFSHAVSFDCHV